MKLSNLWHKAGAFVTHPLGQLVVCAVVGFGGYVFHDYMDFGSEYRKSIESEYKAAVEASDKVGADLHAFAAQALGQRKLETKQIQDLDIDITNLYRRVKDVVEKIPEIREASDQYTETMISLRGSALEMKGPAGAKKFVEDMSRFIAAQDNFNDRVAEERKKYVKQFFRSL